MPIGILSEIERERAVLGGDHPWKISVKVFDTSDEKGARVFIIWGDSRL